MRSPQLRTWLSGSKRRWAVALSVCLIGVGGMFGARYLFGSPACAKDFLAKGRLHKATVTSESSEVNGRFRELRLESAGGAGTSMAVRIPPEGTGPWPTVVLLGGWKTGRRAIERLPDVPWIVASLDYPYDGPRNVRMPFGLLAVPRMREALLATPCAAISALDYLEQMPEVDRERTLAVGVSLGAPMALAAAAADPRFDGVVFGYGGPNVASWANEEMRTHLPGGIRQLVAGGIALITSPLHPYRHLDALGSRPVLVVAGEDDTTIVKSDLESFYSKLRGPKTLVWLPGGHIRPRDASVINEIVSAISEWSSGPDWAASDHAKAQQAVTLSSSARD